MNEEKNTKVVTDCFEAYQKGKIDTLIGLLADDVSWEAVYGAGNRIPTGGLRKGKNGVREFFRQLEESARMESFQVHETIAQGNKVVALGHYAGSDVATGGTYDVDWVMVFEVKNGKVTSFREYTDSAAILDAHGVGAEMGERRPQAKPERRPPA